MPSQPLWKVRGPLPKAWWYCKWTPNNHSYCKNLNCCGEQTYWDILCLLSSLLYCSVMLADQSNLFINQLVVFTCASLCWELSWNKGWISNTSTWSLFGEWELRWRSWSNKSDFYHLKLLVQTVCLKISVLRKKWFACSLYIFGVFIKKTH